MNRRAIVTAFALAALVIAPASPAHAQSSAVLGTPSSSVITFRNELPSSYRLTRVRLVIDGAVRYDGPSFDMAYLPPGGHVVELVASYRMHNAVLSYLDRYGVEVRSSHVVRPPVSHPIHIDARAVHHGGATTPVERSAVISWIDR